MTFGPTFLRRHASMLGEGLSDNTLTLAFGEKTLQTKISSSWGHVWPPGRSLPTSNLKVHFSPMFIPCHWCTELISAFTFKFIQSGDDVLADYVFCDKVSSWFLDSKSQRFQNKKKAFPFPTCRCQSQTKWTKLTFDSCHNEVVVMLFSTFLCLFLNWSAKTGAQLLDKTLDLSGDCRL